jgi:preprotein translocase subunit SecF
MGGSVIHDFAFALLVGVFVGTYSSIFVASPLLIHWEKKIDWQS